MFVTFLHKSLIQCNNLLSFVVTTELCINYCNEALQQQFNHFTFKAEQAEYEYEGIDWSTIQFKDNQEALDLIEDRRSGLFSILDEQCILPRCTDSTFVRAMYEKCEGNKYFSGSQMQKSSVSHTKVVYLFSWPP